jgi:hypothetical protein
VTSSAHPTIERLRSDPVWFARNILGIEPWSKQRQIMEAVRDHERVSVRSAHATGKTTTAATVALWWLAGGPGSIVVTTSATDRQVRKVIWREIARRFRGARHGVFADATLSDLELVFAEDWYAIGLSTDAPENFAGWHGERMLVIVDEASGVGEDIFEAIEGVLAGGESRLLLLGNPTKVGGQFFRSHRSERDQWFTIDISAFDTPAFTGETVSVDALKRLVNRAWVERQRARYGEGSAFYQVRVLGQFPDQGDDGIMGLSVIDAARGRELELVGQPLVVAVDCARYGDDETVIVTRHGPRIRVARAYVGRDLMHTVGEVCLVARELAKAGNWRPVIVVDDAGLGGGVTDRLRQLGEFRVVAFNGAGAARSAEYANRRAEAHFEFRDLLPHLDLDTDGMLRDDLAAPRYRFDSKNRLLVESKDELKKRLGRSPDRGDAAVMAVALPTVALRPSLARSTPITAGLDRALGSSSLADDMRDLMTRKW